MIDNPALDRQMRRDDEVAEYEARQKGAWWDNYTALQNDPELLEKTMWDFLADPFEDLVKIVTAKDKGRAAERLIIEMANAKTEKEVG